MKKKIKQNAQDGRQFDLTLDLTQLNASENIKTIFYSGTDRNPS